ncbi:hypothetical protein BHE74_00017127 [Ensete ventricosum]|nr:hypothetical protein BHE74_00017127 [Ensete ventricosum]
MASSTPPPSIQESSPTQLNYPSITDKLRKKKIVKKVSRSWQDEKLKTRQILKEELNEVPPASKVNNQSVADEQVKGMTKHIRGLKEALEIKRSMIPRYQEEVIIDCKVSVVEMAAEVSSSARTLAGCKEEGEGERELVTRDLLGGEVVLELQVPTAGERRLDLSVYRRRFPWLQSGKTYLRQRESSTATRNLHDLNLSPPSPSVTSLGLKPEAVTSAAPVEYQSVCTLEKVKSALERESRLVATTEPLFPRPDGLSLSPPSTSSSTKRQAEDAGGRTMAVAACPVCLLYVLISTVDPRCPRCAAHVPVNGPRKKPCIDLNFSLQPGNHHDTH